jgi:hypothetical protein
MESALAKLISKRDEFWRGIVLICVHNASIADTSANAKGWVMCVRIRVGIHAGFTWRLLAHGNDLIPN